LKNKIKSLDISKSNIIVKISKDIALQQTAINIMRQNPSPYLVPFYLHTSNNEFHFFYDIQTKISLSEFLNENTTEKDFYNIIQSIFSGIINAKEYYAKESSFLLHENFIFINPLSVEISLIYLPIDIDVDFFEIIKSFLLVLIENSSFIPISDSGLLNTIKKIISSQNFTMNEIVKAFENKKTRRIPPEKIIQSEITFEKKPSIFIPNTRPVKPLPSAPPQIKSLAKIHKFDKISSFIKRFKIKALRSPSSKDSSNISPNNSSKVSSELSDKRSNKTPIKNLKAISKKAVYSGLTNDLKKENKSVVFLNNSAKKTKDISKEDSTIDFKFYILKENKDNIEKFVINKNIISIGSAVNCDIVLESAKVNYIHAKIITENDSLFLINSSYNEDVGFNGLFLNSLKIETSNKIALKNYDKIKLYNFVLIIRIEN
jgi:hypothetical protein